MEPHKLDQQWIKQQISLIPPGYKKQAIDGYKRVFKEAYYAEPVEHKKSNAARRAANTRLRLFVKKLLA